MEFQHVLDKFSINELKPFQKEALNALIEKKDVYLSVKTGGGKSLCYQAFPLLWTEHDPTRHDVQCKVIIISPLLSIMKEQSEYLTSLGFAATYIGSDDNDNDILEGKYQFLFTSPESLLAISKWRCMLRSPAYKDLQLFVVDEAHTVLQWGESAHDDNPFRAWYGNLGEIRSLTECPILLITATANEAARQKMRRKFTMKNCKDIIDNPDRENVKLFVKREKATRSLNDIFGFLIADLKKDKHLCARYIIFCTTIDTCGELFSMFRMELNQDIKYVQMYHSKTPDRLKEEIRANMKESEGHLRILIATSAAGMGVNFSNLNQVINFGPPKDMDSFVQQIGRAGRSSPTTAMALLLYTGRQCRNLDLDMKEYINNDSECRRQILLKAYKAKPKRNRNGHGCCDICSKKCHCGGEDCTSFEHPSNLHVPSEYDESSESDSDLNSEFDLNSAFESD